jgi:hypothetical protein
MPEIAPGAFDQVFRALEGSPLMHRLTAEAMGDQYPAEVQPFSSCGWWLLGEFVAGLRIGPGDTLLDLGCGRGGPGLWLARARLHRREQHRRPAPPRVLPAALRPLA